MSRKNNLLEKAKRRQAREFKIKKRDESQKRALQKLIEDKKHEDDLAAALLLWFLK